ncbi:MAG TPA: DUF1573 domain-containing protein [Puia sp.]|jgi:hypothetical protein|nr:DUF1573 domain-containing protein [Puia sp.]
MRLFLTGSLFPLIAVLALSCHNSEPANVKAAMADSAHYTTIAWLDSLSRNYGTIIEGDKLNVTFHFRNIGTTPLVIGHVQPSCGCTIAEQPQGAIAPGKDGQIRATFNSEGHAGVNHKTLFVTANTRGVQNYSLQFVVQVEKKSS